MHEEMLRAWLRNRFPTLGDIDDIIQESYAKVLAARERQPLRSPKAFFFATARNLAIDHLRKFHPANTKYFGGSEELALLEDADDITETVARNQEVELMTQAIQSLPRRCRQVMTLRNVYGLSQKEIAGQLGISVRTVEAQVAFGVSACTRFVMRLNKR